MMKRSKILESNLEGLLGILQTKYDTRLTIILTNRRIIENDVMIMFINYYQKSEN